MLLKKLLSQTAIVDLLKKAKEKSIYLKVTAYFLSTKT